MVAYEEAIRVLQNLKENAESVDRNEDSVFADYRGVAAHDMREIIDTLLRLDLDGEILGPDETQEGPLIGALRMLKDSAEVVDRYEDDIIDDYRNMAESDKRDIVETLLKLDLDGKGIEPMAGPKSEAAAPVSIRKEETQAVEAEAFWACLMNCDWIIDHAKELKALVSYNSGEMIRANFARAASAISSMRETLDDIEEFILGKEMDLSAKPLGTVLADATKRSEAAPETRRWVFEKEPEEPTI